MPSKNSIKYDEVADNVYKTMFGKQFDEEVDKLKKDVMDDMNTYEDYILDIPIMCNVTIDNISVSCDDVILAAKIATLLTAYNIKELNNANALDELIKNIHAIGSD